MRREMRLTLVPVFQRSLCQRPVQIRPDGDRSALVCAYAPIMNASVIATMSAVRISASPVFLRLRDRSKVNRCADEERRELVRCTGGNLRLRSARTGEQQSCLKSWPLRKVTPNFFGIWPP